MTAPTKVQNLQRCETFSNEDVAFSTEPTRKAGKQQHKVGKAVFAHVNILRTGKKEAARAEPHRIYLVAYPTKAKKNLQFTNAPNSTHGSVTLAFSMESTARPSRYVSEGQHRWSGPRQYQYENWGYSVSDKQSKQINSAKHHSNLRHKPPGNYRQGTSESPSPFLNDPYMRQARNAAVPYGYNYNPSYYPSYQAHPNPPMQYYLPPSASKIPAGYPGSYTYPGQGGNLSVLRTGNPVEQPSGPSRYGHPSRGYSESDRDFDEYSYNEDVPPPPDYPTQDPLRTPVRPREHQTPNVQPQRDTRNYREKAERRPRKKRLPIPKKEEILPENNYTNAEIMEVLNRIEQSIRENTRIRSDPGRRQHRGRRNSPSASEFLLDDIRSLDIDRQASRQINGIIRRLLDDREDQRSRDSYTGTPMSRFADSSQSGTEIHDRERSFTSLRDLQSLKSRVDLIMDYLESGNSPSQQQQPETYSNRQNSHIPRHQVAFASDPSVLESNLPTSSRSPPRRSQYFPPQVEDVPEDYDE